MRLGPVLFVVALSWVARAADAPADEPANDAKPAEEAASGEPEAKPAEPEAKASEPEAKPAEPEAKPAEPEAKPTPPLQMSVEADDEDDKDTDDDAIRGAGPQQAFARLAAIDDEVVYENEASIEGGLNAPGGFGVRYMRRIEGTRASAGLALALYTAWGPKVAFLARWNEGQQEGMFVQASVGLSGGEDGVVAAVKSGGVDVNATFQKTAGRTADFAAGYRIPLKGLGFLDLFAGFAFRLQGSWLQTAPAGTAPVVIDEDSREQLFRATPGGFVLGGAYGWLF